jgi:hypothetical protein
MNKKIFLFLGLMLAVGLLVTGCGKSAAEKAAEKAVENATNGDASVDIDNQQVTINTNGSSYQAGGDVSLPDGFPTDVYVVDGKISMAYTYEKDKSYSIGISTEKTLAELKALYEQQMKEKGWASQASLDTATAVTISYTKTVGRTTNVSITKDATNANQWFVTITTQVAETDTNSADTNE